MTAYRPGHFPADSARGIRHPRADLLLVDADGELREIGSALADRLLDSRPEPLTL